TMWPRDWSSDVCSSDLILEKKINYDWLIIAEGSRHSDDEPVVVDLLLEDLHDGPCDDRDDQDPRECCESHFFLLLRRFCAPDDALGKSPPTGSFGRDNWVPLAQRWLLRPSQVGAAQTGRWSP